MTAATFTVVGLCVEMLAVGLGVYEVWSTRKAALGFIGRAHFVNASGRGGLSLSSSGRTTMPGGGEPTMDDRAAALESRLEALKAQGEALPEELEKLLRMDINGAINSLRASERHLEESLDWFAQDLGAGRWRRYGTVVLLLLGAALQVAGAALHS